MKAVVYSEYGSPDVLRVSEIEKPVPRDNEVLIKIHATTITAGDWRALTLKMPSGFGPVGRLVFAVRGPRQPLLGIELAGEIESVGKEVSRFKAGDQVFASTGTHMGSHAEYRCMPEDGAVELDGVLHASIDPRSRDVWIVRDADYDAAPIELAVRNRIASLGHDLAGGQIRVTLPTAAGPRRRVRFVEAARSEDPRGVTVTVSLEWNNVVHNGVATGERGPAVELKTTAHAALNALEKLSGQSLEVRIIGIKQVHAFDSDLMVASMIRTQGPPQRLVGAVLVADNPLNSAALAVLSGLNRTLGNFLHTPD
jgi:hypothetical protein